MQVSVETTSGLERRMTVEVPEERIASEVDRRLRNLARTTRVKGFRPGKAPMKIIEAQYGDQVRHEVLGELVQSSFQEAVTREKLRPAGYPAIEVATPTVETSFAYIATFEVMPEIQLGDMSAVRIEKQAAEVSEADVDKMMETLRKQRATWSEVQRPAENGDRVTIDFTGTINGEPFAGNEGKNVPVTLGGGRMIPGFEEGIVGASAGEERSVDIAFPEDYSHKDVAGKPVRFIIKVSKVEAPVLPEVNEDFAKLFGVADGGVEALRKEVRENMERELKQRLRAQLKQATMDRIIEVNPIEVPKALVRQEAESLAEQLRQNMRVPQGKQGPAIDSSMFDDQARKRVALGLVVAEIVRRNEIKARPERVRAAVENIAASYEDQQQVINWYYGDRRRLAEVESLVLEDEVVDWVLGTVQVEEKPTTFDAVMNPNG